jgi:hypothetical protein
MRLTARPPLVLATLVYVTSTVAAEGDAKLARRVPLAAKPALTADRFKLATDVAPRRLGARYLQLAQDIHCLRGELLVVMFDSQKHTRIERRLPCPVDGGNPRLLRYAPEHGHVGWFYTRRVDKNPFDFNTDRQKYLDHELLQREVEGLYVEQDLSTRKLGVPLPIFRSTGYAEAGAHIELAADDRSVDAFFTEFGAHERANARIARLDLVERMSSIIFEATAATHLEFYWDPTHTWVVAAGWLDRFDTAYDRGATIFFNTATKSRFQLPSSGSVSTVLFDLARKKAYVGSHARGDVWRVDLTTKKIETRRRGFGLVNNILLHPDKPLLALLPSYPHYVTTTLRLDKPTRHAYEPLFATDAPFPWQHATITTLDGRTVIYTSLRREAAILTWRSDVE